jgi:hypothetical protein
MKRWTIALAGLGLVLTLGCNKTGKEGAETPAPIEEPSKLDPTPTDEPTERPTLTAAECEAASGTVVGDIGDGAIHRPDYRCANGQAPIGSIKAVEGEPVAVEGAVCCGA